MAPALLSFATATLLASCGGRPAASDTIPFELVRNQIVLRVPFESGDTLTMLLDTGVNPSTIDVAVARRVGMLVSEEPIGFAAGAGSGERAPLYRARIAGMRLGATAIRALDAVAVDHAALSSKIGRPLHGILGYSFLHDRRVRIDYPRRVIVLEPAGVPRGRALFADSLRLVPNDIMPLVTIVVNGAELPVSLDTGSSLDLELFPRGAEHARLAADTGRMTQLRGAAGTFTSRNTRADRIALGSATQRDGDVYLSPQRGPEARWGNLGNGFLQHFVLTLDYVGRRLTLHEMSDR